jgi:protocatechuate 3,4-dioxygenase beta subunit
MNSRRASFTSLPANNLSAAIIKKGALLFICLLTLTADVVRAQEPRIVEKKEARAERPAATGTITGRVVSEDGRPVADAMISYFKAYSRVVGPRQTATADSDGRFRLTGLEPGLYNVHAMMPGFVNATEPVGNVNESGFYRPGDSVNLTLMKGGVITGTVRDANGEPVVAVVVRAMRIRDANGKAQFSSTLQERMTDDRGVYRIYGLPPGTYVVSAGGSQRFYSEFNAYENDAPTFFPSSTNDTASEVSVRGGEEATGIDIRYRGERGHAVSGTISGAIEENNRYGITISLRQTVTGGYEAGTFVNQGTKQSFSFYGVADGEYELIAQQWGRAGESIASIPRRITVKGNDVTGIELKLAPLGSISGRVVLEGVLKENCGDTRNATLLETAVNALRDLKNQSEASPQQPFFAGGATLPTEQGEFMIPNLMTGSYRLTARLPTEAWYVRSVTLPTARQPAAQSKSAETKSAPPASFLALKMGERISGVTVNIAQDAAALRGRVVSATEGAALPANLKVHLVPAERERAEDLLRYSEVPLGSDGAFTLTNLAPGRYWIIARPAPDDAPERMLRPLAWDATERAKLRREAEAANTAVELQSCQRIADYALRLRAP